MRDWLLAPTTFSFEWGWWEWGWWWKKSGSFPNLIGGAGRGSLGESLTRPASAESRAKVASGGHSGGRVHFPRAGYRQLERVAFGRNQPARPVSHVLGSLAMRGNRWSGEGAQWGVVGRGFHVGSWKGALLPLFGGRTTGSQGPATRPHGAHPAPRTWVDELRRRARRRRRIHAALAPLLGFPPENTPLRP